MPRQDQPEVSRRHKEAACLTRSLSLGCGIYISTHSHGISKFPQTDSVHPERNFARLVKTLSYFGTR